MFSTELNHLLQSIDSEFFAWLMKAISYFGNTYVIIPLLIILMYGFHFRKGFVMIQVTAWASLFIGFFKNLFALPRPFDVDSSLIPFGAEYTLPAGRFRSTGSHTFWGTLPSEIVFHLREAGLSNYGFPSGHVTISTTFFGTLFLLYRNTWVRIMSVFFILSMPVSRIFLARHFLADTLGGLALGGMIILIAWSVLLRPPAFRKFQGTRLMAFFHFRVHWVWWLSMFVLPAAMLFFPETPVDLAGQLIGFNLAFVLIVAGGFPEHTGHAVHALFRVLLLIVLMGVLIVLHTWLADHWAFLETSGGEFISAFLVMFLGIWTGTGLCIRWGWYRRRTAV
ncbi:MAG: phosphatase PAP2 family protein [Bacteroidales bacterium]